MRSLPSLQVEIHTRRRYVMATMKKSTQVGLLIAALVVGALAAAATRANSKSHKTKHEIESIPELAAAAPSAEHGANDVSSLQGPIQEVIQVPHYTYLRIGASGQPGTWAAVTSSPDLKVGDAVRVVQAQAMHNFQSSVLKRNFETIYFGAIDGRGQSVANGATAGNANPHAGMDMADNPHGATNPAMPPSDVNGTNPHAQVPASSDSIPIGKVTKAKGNLGHTVADIFRQTARPSRTKLFEYAQWLSNPCPALWGKPLCMFGMGRVMKRLEISI